MGVSFSNLTDTSASGTRVLMLINVFSEARIPTEGCRDYYLARYRRTRVERITKHTSPIYKNRYKSLKTAVTLDTSGRKKRASPSLISLIKLVRPTFKQPGGK